MLFSKERQGRIYEDPTKPGLRRRLLNTLLLVLGFRLLANLPVAHVDHEKLNQLLAQNPILGAIDLLAGGDVLKDFSVVAVGLFPYLLAAGLVRLAARVVPPLRRLEKASEAERFKAYARGATFPVAILVAWGLTRYFALAAGLYPAHLHWLTPSTFWSTLGIVAVMTLGTWLTGKITDAITKHGIGPGEDVILLIGSSVALVGWTSDQVFGAASRAAIAAALGLHALVAVAVIVISIPLLTAERKIPMVGKQRPAGRPAPSPRLPLPLSRGGLTPITSAIGAIFLFQLAALALNWAFPGRWPAVIAALLAPTRPERDLYWSLLAALIILFTYLSNFTMLWMPYGDSNLSLAEDLRKRGEVVSGFPPGTRTAKYLSSVMARITLPAAAVMAGLAAGLPCLILRLWGLNVFVAVLAVMVFVQSFLGVRERFQLYREMDRVYGTPLIGRRRP